MLKLLLCELFAPVQPRLDGEGSGSSSSASPDNSTPPYSIIVSYSEKKTQKLMPTYTAMTIFDVELF